MAARCCSRPLGEVIVWDLVKGLRGVAAALSGVPGGFTLRSSGSGEGDLFIGDVFVGSKSISIEPPLNGDSNIIYSFMMSYVMSFFSYV